VHSANNALSLSSISRDDTTGQLKHRLWQTVTQFKAIPSLLTGWKMCESA